MLILAFDTATTMTTAAVSDGEKVLASTEFTGAMSHGELLAPAIEQVLREAKVEITELTDIAVGVGPGPFTGLRVGVATALTLANSLQIPAHGVCTLDIIAAEIELADFFVLTDARRKEVYWAHYQSGKRVSDPAVGSATEIELGESPAFGRGAQIYGLTVDTSYLDPKAAVLASSIAAQKLEPLPLEPLYLRRPDITMPTSVKKA